MVLNHCLINQYIDTITPAQDKSPVNVSLLCSSFNKHERIIQELPSLRYSWGQAEGDAACRRCVCLSVHFNPTRHTYAPEETRAPLCLAHAAQQTGCGNACFILMTSPSWQGSWDIFHRLSSVAVARPPPILLPSLLNVYNSRSMNDLWHRFTGPIQRQHYAMVQNPSLTPSTQTHLELPDHLMQGVYGYLLSSVWEECWVGLTRVWCDMWQPSEGVYVS